MSSATLPVVPTPTALLLPTLRAVARLGGSGGVSEIVAGVIELAWLTEAQQDVLHKDGPQTEVAYRIAWAQTHLKRLGLLNNSVRGVWALTEEGDRFLRDPQMSDSDRVEELAQLRRALRKEDRERREVRVSVGTLVEGDDIAIETDPFEDGRHMVKATTWKEDLIATLTASEFTPAQFERLAQRLLREAGFESVKVTGQSGDQGIDGVGVYRLGLLTFPVFFQCKRYAGNVGAGAVRDFRGAMQGRGDKGLLITTGTFTKPAKEEAARDGATPVDLIDGDRLCDLLRQYELGVVTRVISREESSIRPDFFADI
ncbi:MAG TPA: restriction endonuclease [Arachnia sp.]|nr:restriction endonuclease [Arachnia sp.]HMT86919.1 restriction endonuclease [Arachnia sp.]